MSGKKNSGRSSKPTLHAVAEDPAGYVPATEAGKSLWSALLEHPDSSAAELAIAAGIGKSTAPKLLTQWLAEGRVTKTPGIAHGGTRVADRWAIVGPTPTGAPEPTGADHNIADPATIPMSAETSAEVSVDAPETPDATERPQPGIATADEPKATAPAENTVRTGTIDSPPVTLGEKKARLSKGALHGLVEDVFHENPGTALGPSAISSKLQRSSGAVANACARLVEKGVLVRTQDSPKRYALATQE